MSHNERSCLVAEQHWNFVHAHAENPERSVKAANLESLNGRVLAPANRSTLPILSALW